MENLKALSFELRKNVVDMVVEGGGGHIGGDMSCLLYTSRGLAGAVLANKTIYFTLLDFQVYVIQGNGPLIGFC